MTKKLHQKQIETIVSRIENGEIPRYLYKYRILNTPGSPDELFQYTKDIIIKSVLWHPSPADLNDPFDCHINLDGNLNKEEIKLFTNRIFSGHSREKRRAMAEKFYKNPKQRHDTFMGSIRRIIDGTGLCSYGTAGDNILMWSHYGDSHKGVCFKFDLLADPSEYWDMFPITYSEKYPKIKVVSFDDKDIITLFSTKSDIWSYEKEWRVFTRTGPGLIPFRKNVLTEVIFGCSASETNIRAMQEIIEQNKGYNHVALKRATISKQSFSLKIKDL